MNSKVEKFFKYNKTDEIALKECSKIEKIRSRLFSLGLIGAHCNGTCYGNISLKYKKKNFFVITGTNTAEYPKLSASYYSLVKKVDLKTPLIFAVGPSLPSIQSALHYSVYSIDSKINAVIHVYSEKIIEYMIDNDYLCIANTTHDYLKRANVKKDINDLYSNVDPFLNNAFIITGDINGIVVFGKTLGEAEKALYSIINKVIKS